MYRNIKIEPELIINDEFALTELEYQNDSFINKNCDDIKNIHDTIVNDDRNSNLNAMCKNIKIEPVDLSINDGFIVTTKINDMNRFHSMYENIKVEPENDKFTEDVLNSRPRYNKLKKKISEPILPSTSTSVRTVLQPLKISQGTVIVNDKYAISTGKNLHSDIDINNNYNNIKCRRNKRIQNTKFENAVPVPDLIINNEFLTSTALHKNKRKKQQMLYSLSEGGNIVTSLTQRPANTIQQQQQQQNYHQHHKFPTKNGIGKTVCKITTANATEGTSKTKKPKTFQCDLCDKMFSRTTLLKEHRTLHTGEILYTCNICNEKFQKYTQLSSHRYIHMTKLPHPCHICSKSFRRPSLLKLHLNKDHLILDSVKYNCNLCSKSFLTLTKLKTHKKVHLPNKRFCKICGRKFNRSTPLKEHEALHTGEKPFKCQFCDKIFQRYSYLYEHRNIVHYKKTPITCSVCDKQFPRPHKLREHCKKIHQTIIGS